MPNHLAVLGETEVDAEFADVPAVSLRNAVLGQANTDRFRRFSPNDSNALTLDKSRR
jgi:hypothetical protein